MTLTAAQVTVDATSGGVALNTAGTKGQKLTIRNTDATATNTVVLGPSGITTTTGYILAGGAAITVELSAGEALFGIRGTANSVVVSVLRSNI